MKIKCPLCAAEIEQHKLNQHAGSKRCVMAMKPVKSGYDWRKAADRIGSVSDLLHG